MKKNSFFLLVLAFILMTMSLASNAAHYQPGATDGDASSNTAESFVFNSNQVYVWTLDGIAAHGYGCSLTDTEEDVPENNIALLAGKVYEYVYCDIGETADQFPAEVSGKIALIMRGVCTFTVKSENAKNAGAIGAVVFNDFRDEETGDDGFNISYSDTDFGMSLDYATIPMTFISSDIGTMLNNASDKRIFIGTKVQFDAYKAEQEAAAQAVVEPAADEAAPTTVPASVIAAQTADAFSVMAALIALSGVSIIIFKKR